MGVRGVLEDIATVAQLSGLHAIMLIALAARLLRIPQCEAECAKLEECARRLRALLQWPAPTGHEVATQLPAMAAEALVEADGLVGSYRRSTLWCRVRTCTSMEARLRGMHDRVECLCALVLGVHANLLTFHLTPHATATNNHVISDPLHGGETSDSQRYHNGTVQGGTDHHVIGDPLHGAETCDASDSVREEEEQTTSEATPSQ